MNSKQQREQRKALLLRQIRLVRFARQALLFVSNPGF